MLKIGIPWGSLFKKVVQLFADAGLPIIPNSNCERDFRISINDPRIGVVEISHAKQIPREVDLGFFDLGFTSEERIIESAATIREEDCLARFNFSKNGNQPPIIALVTSAENNANLDLSTAMLGGRMRIGTELPFVTRRFFKQKGVNDFRIIQSYGSTEAMIPRRADFIVELVDSGESISANGLVIVEKIMDVPPMLIACWEAIRNPDKRKLMFEIRDQLVAADKK